MNEKIGLRQRRVWQMAAISAVAACCLCKISWPWVLVGSVIAAGYQRLLEKNIPEEGLAKGAVVAWGGFGKFVLLVTWGWTIYMMGWAAQLADRAFQVSNGTQILGLTVLTLTAWGSWKGIAVCARCCGVLSLFLLCLYGVILAFAVPEIRVKNLYPTGNWSDSAEALALLFVASGGWYGPFEKKRRERAWGLLLLPLITVGVSVVTAGVLSPALTDLRKDPFYDVTKSISLFGVMERVEPLLSAAITMGVFALLTTMAAACQSIGAEFKQSRWYGSGSCAIAALLLMLQNYKWGEIRIFGAILIWMIVPMLIIMGNRRKGDNP